MTRCMEDGREQHFSGFPFGSVAGASVRANLFPPRRPRMDPVPTVGVVDLWRQV